MSPNNTSHKQMGHMESYNTNSSNLHTQRSKGTLEQEESVGLISNRSIRRPSNARRLNFAIKKNNFTKGADESDAGATLDSIPTTQISFNYNMAAQKNRKKGTYMF